ncbi:MAG: PIN domain-containing protein [Defluviitaleaceae bacterium]|nr:PIN domain-containing protein [Defluviitaleaceae bacterium]
MRVLIDTNVIMDFIVERGSFTSDAEKVIGLCIEKRIPCCITAHTVPNLFYILRKHLSIEERRDVLLKICKMFTVVGIDSNKLESALQDSNFEDFEDCLQVQCAKDFPADFIVTRNVKDFANSSVSVLEPVKLIAKLSEL